MPVPLKKIVAAMDAELRTSEIKDYDRACNGLQMENNGRVTKIAAAVDSHLPVLEQAVAAGADLFLCHHGIMWSAPVPVVGVGYQKIKFCLENNLAIYGSHLPLDMHPRLGNNALLAKALGLKRTRPFAEAKGETIGISGEISLSVGQLTARLEKILDGPVHLIQGHDRPVRKVGIVTGGAGWTVAEAAKCGLDTFISGEGGHDTYGTAKELGVNLLYGGHYATETFGVKALAAWVSKKFHVPWVFLDHPSGM